MKLKTLTDKIENDFISLAEYDSLIALEIITGVFVSFVLTLVEKSGHDKSKSITLDGGDKRNITIHPEKIAEK